MAEDFVIDNSVVMSWCFKDETSKYTDAILERLSNAHVYVPAIWPLEVCNVLLVAERRKRLNQKDSAYFISLLLELPIIVEQETPARMFSEIFALAREFKMSSYDAAYLDLAMRKGLPIATTDRDMIFAAKKAGVIIEGIK